MDQKLRTYLVDNFKSDFIDGAEWMYDKLMIGKKELLNDFAAWTMENEEKMYVTEIEVEHYLKSL